MNSRDITLWLDERWYDALSYQLQRRGTTIEDELNDCLDAMIDQLPERVRERISREIWEEEQRRQVEEAARRCSALRVTQDGRTDHLLAEGNAAMDAYHTALRLRDYLLRESSSTERFVQTIPAAMAITPDEFRECVDGLRQGPGRMKAVLDIDLDQGRFSALDAVGCQDVYAIRDVCVAASHKIYPGDFVGFAEWISEAGCGIVVPAPNQNKEDTQNEHQQPNVPHSHRGLYPDCP